MTNKKTFTSLSEEDPIMETGVTKEFLNFLSDELKNIYSAEKNLSKAIPKLQKATSNKALKNIFDSHLASSRLQSERLEQIFNLLGESVKLKGSEAMTALLDEANGTIEKTTKSSGLRDAAIILAIQKIRHYEIASYTTLLQLARTFGDEDIISLLETTLAEEKKADDLLNSFGEENFNSAGITTKSIEPVKDEAKVATVYSSKNLEGKKPRKKDKD